MNHFISLHTQPKYLIKRFNIIASTLDYLCDFPNEECFEKSCLVVSLVKTQTKDTCMCAL